MDVRCAADGTRVAEALGYSVDRGDDVRLHRGLALEGTALAQGACRQHRAPPGAEVFGGERLPGNLVQVGVDILGTDGTGIAVVVEVLEQMLAWEIL